MFHDLDLDLSDRPNDRERERSGSGNRGGLGDLRGGEREGRGFGDKALIGWGGDLDRDFDSLFKGRVCG